MCCESPFLWQILITIKYAKHGTTVISFQLDSLESECCCCCCCPNYHLCHQKLSEIHHHSHWMPPQFIIGLGHSMGGHWKLIQQMHWTHLKKWKIIEAGCWVSTVGCWRLEILFVWQWLLHWSTLVTRDRSRSTCCQHLNSGHRTERGKMISMLALANSWCWC